MEKKKNTQKEINNQRGLFMSIGLIISISLCLVALEWKSNINVIEKKEVLHSKYEEQMEEMPMEPKIQSKPVVVQPVVVEVKDDIEEEEIDLKFEPVNQGEKSEGTREEIIPDNHPIEPEKYEDPIVNIASEMPEPEGGMKEFYKYLQKELKYPKLARSIGTTGKVFIQFTVEKDGHLADFKLVKGIGGGCDEEAMRVLQKAPKWKPGKNSGRAVRVRMTIPIHFKLD